MSMTLAKPNNNHSVTECNDHENKNTYSSIGHILQVYWIPEIYKLKIDDGQFRVYRLSILQRIFLTLDSPTSCVLAERVSMFILMVILLNVVIIIISTLSVYHKISNSHTVYELMCCFAPIYRVIPHTCTYPACNNDPTLCPGYQICQPEPKPIFNLIDLYCVVFFTIDFGIRLILCPIMPTRLSGVIPPHWDEIEKERARRHMTKPWDEPYYTPPIQFLRYVFSLHTAIDFIAIAPTYITLGLNSKSQTTLSFIRILRLLRLLRVVRINTRGKMIVDLLSRTMYASREAIVILMFYVSLLIILFASLMFAVEQGRFTVNSDYPDGAYLRPDGLGGKERSNFDSIPTSIYYVIITMSTVGYGDLSPTTLAGRAIASACAMAGVLVIALPISIVGSNFNTEYTKYLQKKHEQTMSDAVRKRALHKLWSKPVTEAGKQVTNIITKFRRLSMNSSISSTKGNFEHARAQALAEMGIVTVSNDTQDENLIHHSVTVESEKSTTMSTSEKDFIILPPSMESSDIVLLQEQKDSNDTIISRDFSNVDRESYNLISTNTNMTNTTTTLESTDPIVSASVSNTTSTNGTIKINPHRQVSFSHSNQSSLHKSSYVPPLPFQQLFTNRSNYISENMNTSTNMSITTSHNPNDEQDGFKHKNQSTLSRLFNRHAEPPENDETIFGCRQAISMGVDEPIIGSTTPRTARRTSLNSVYVEDIIGLSDQALESLSKEEIILLFRQLCEAYKQLSDESVKLEI